MIETNESLKLSLKLIFVASVGFICWSLSDITLLVIMI